MAGCPVDLADSRHRAAAGDAAAAAVLCGSELLAGYAEDWAEAAAGWRRHIRHDAGADFVANFVDLGRPPIVGLVEPDRELRRLAAELAELDKLTEVP